jgi:hypothetical protein
VCDENAAVCDYGITVNPTTNQSVITGTVSTATEVTAQPCDITERGLYTALPIRITAAAPQQRVSSVVVEAQVTSLAAQELNLWLKSPSGTFTPLLTSSRLNTVNIHPRFSASAITDTTSLTSTVDITGSATEVKPDGNLALLNGEPLNGTWQLLACDHNENSTHSTINSWSLALTSASTSVSTNAPWSYTVKDTANQDNVIRILNLWGIDSTNNASNWSTIALNIDTVAPSFTINQQMTSLLPDAQETVFQGTASDGGTISSISANIYDATTLARTINVELQQTSSQELSRWNYLLSRSINAYTWQLPIDASTLDSGEYRVQFVAIDAAGNQRISDAYPLTIAGTTAPSLSNIGSPASRRTDAAILQYSVNTGSGPTKVVSTISLDSDVTAPISNTTLMMWNSSGITDTVAQNQITTTLQATLFSQLEMNNHLAAALDTNNILTTWAISNTNTISLTSPISNVVQIALGDSSNQHLLTLSSSGVITDYQPGNIVQTVTVPISDTAVAITAGTTHNLAILRSGKLFTWGSNTNGETTIPISATMGVSQITAGNGFSLALKSDGRVIGWGANDLNQTTIPISATVGVSQIAAGDNHAIALRSDGVVVAWGDNSGGQTTVPISATNVVYVAANANSSAAITRDGLVLVWGATQSVSSCCPGTSSIALNSSQIMTNQMDSSQTQTITRQAGLTPITVQNRFYGLLPGRRYRYTLVVTNERGSMDYSGVFDTSLRYDQHYLPFLTNTNADGVDPVNTTSGK